MNGKSKILNPDNAMMQQSEGQWQKYLLMVIHKLAPEGVSIGIEDMKAFQAQEKQVLLTHGHYDSIEFKLVTPAEAEKIAEHDKQQHGHS